MVQERLERRMKLVQRLQSQVPKSTGTPSVNSGGQVEVLLTNEKGKPVTLLLTRRPIGLDFSYQAPFVVVNVSGHAAELGIKKGWQLRRVGQLDLDKLIAYSNEEVMEFVRQQTAMLPEKIRDSERQMMYGGRNGTSLK